MAEQGDNSFLDGTVRDETMTEKEMKKLSRAELLEMLIAQSIELENCKEKLNAAEVALKNREIAINRAGSIAEASLALSGIFDAAQLACQQYTENIRLLSERQQDICADLEAEGRAKAQQIVMEAEKKRKDTLSKTQKECEAMRSKAKAESQQYWEEVSGKLQTFLDAHTGLRELLAMVTPAEKQE